jgi:hypothetical protein
MANENGVLMCPSSSLVLLEIHEHLQLLYSTE